jgi:hypothetical protein
VHADDREDALRLLSSDAFDPAQSVLLEAALPHVQHTTTPGYNVEFLRYATNEAELRVRTLSEAILVFSDSYYPGWVAQVDGHETPIYRANITQRAVVVPAGEHHVLFRFRPSTVVVGFWISFAAFIVFLGCLFGPRLRTKRSQPQPAREAILSMRAGVDE